MRTYAEIQPDIDACEAELKALRAESSAAHDAETKSKPVLERMVFAAYSRCPCGAGLAYDPASRDEGSVFKGSLAAYWDCSAIILGTADAKKQHTARLPFAFYSIKSENQDSVNGATTRPKQVGTSLTPEQVKPETDAILADIDAIEALTK